MSKEFKVIELNRNERVRLCHTVVDSFAFSGKDVLDDKQIVQNPGIVYAQEKVDNSTKNVYIVAGIIGILADAAESLRSVGDKAARDTYVKKEYVEVVDKVAIAINSSDYRLFSSGDIDYRVKNVQSGIDCVVNQFAQEAKDASDCYVRSIKAAVAAAADAKKALEKVSDGKEFGLDVKLKTAYMAYWVAEFVLNRMGKFDTGCAAKAGVLKEVIEAMSFSCQSHTGNAE